MRAMPVAGRFVRGHHLVARLIARDRIRHEILGDGAVRQESPRLCCRNRREVDERAQCQPSRTGGSVRPFRRAHSSNCSGVA